ncbi:mitochondrial import inner membrane translocase subunit TIM44-like [Megalops cyprinoides]|uniref:mitochondrial import inner membrane translocase subunit TIM44-like n=1 Tax=Megalops cyprinoides TaxID=118141 RepID=UPI001863F7BF|nr:mitochondrial import inner membrane translocase subunit TIM44-like [Megalops cyprinoides]
MAASLCQCYQLCVRRGLFFLSTRSYVSILERSHVYRICGSPSVSSQMRYASGGGGGRKGFLGEFVDSLKQELNKNKEMKENIKKFREEAKKLEDSEALRQARRKYKTIESETVKTSEVLKKKLGSLSETVKESLEEVGRSDLGKKIKEGVEEAAKTAKQSAESVSKSGEVLGKTGAFRAISQGMESVKKEIDDLGQSGPYRAPAQLRKRSDFSSKGVGSDSRVFEANEEAMGVVLHKDSKWYQQWKDFKDNNMVFNRFFEMKMKYDESDNVLIRASRAVTDKVTDLLGGLLSKTEMSEVLTEILKADPNFDKDAFLKQCERDIIPNVLEAMIRGELEVLKDWCYEATYSQLAHPIQQARAMGLHFHSKILDIDNIDLAMGKIMEQGPVLIITFQAQVVMVIRSPKGDVVEGDPDKVLRMMYVWALCRDQEELNPYAAWRLLDISASSTEQVL